MDEAEAEREQQEQQIAEITEEAAKTVAQENRTAHMETNLQEESLREQYEQRTKQTEEAEKRTTQEGKTSRARTTLLGKDRTSWIQCRNDEVGMPNR